MRSGIRTVSTTGLCHFAVKALLTSSIYSPRQRLVLSTKQYRTTDLRCGLLRVRRCSRMADLVSELRSSSTWLQIDIPLSHYKSWRVTLLIPWGAFLMVAGFVMREVGAFDVENLGILIASIVLLLSGP
jgi:hypothetical protein